MQKWQIVYHVADLNGEALLPIGGTVHLIDNRLGLYELEADSLDGARDSFEEACHAAYSRLGYFVNVDVVLVQKSNGAPPTVKVAWPAAS